MQLLHACTAPQLCTATVEPVVGDLLPQTGHCRLAVGRWPAGGGSPSDMGWMIADSCDGCAQTPEHKLRNTIEGKPSDDTYRTN